MATNYDLIIDWTGEKYKVSTNLPSECGSIGNMETSFALVCENVSQTSEGKLNLIGVFRQINANSFPVLHPAMTFAAEVDTEPIDAGKHIKLCVQLVNELDPVPMFHVEWDREIPAARDWEPDHLRILLPLHNMVLPRAGYYSFMVYANGDLLGRADIEARLLPEAVTH